ncbi:Putative 50S ribosomal protein L20 [Arabidopsis thaliana]|uniref:50S ribosomal protein L20 n=1 Tax=Arabidopsis thaliana TaxID=3702 RepID=Q9FWQ8_ARATH|nr:Putative 50S ribosomal protein L20 [Arabidopsis thaliana]
MNKKEIFKLAKGFRGRAKNCIRIARERVEKALQYSYRDRRNKKREMRGLWIERINAGSLSKHLWMSPASRSLETRTWSKHLGK